MVGKLGFSYGLDGYKKVCKNIFDNLFYGKPKDEKYCDFHDEEASNNQSHIFLQKLLKKSVFFDDMM